MVYISLIFCYRVCWRVKELGVGSVLFVCFILEVGEIGERGVGV